VDIDTDGEDCLMRFRSGNTLKVPADSWVINCTGYIARHEHEYEPYLSARGTTISIQPTSGIHFLSTFGAYFLTHMHFLGKLPDLGLYELDYQTLMRDYKEGFAFVSISHTLYNLMLMLNAAPMTVFTRCGLDFDNWYPFHRRLLGGMKLRMHNAAYRKKFKSALDTVRQKHQFRCGELNHR
ncbi:MAG: potassium transporter, partial [Pseudomonadota bacterium]